MESASKQNDAAERGPSKGGRVRTCVGCGERVDASDGRGAPALVRLILGPGGVIAVDPGDGGFGRGAHVHPRPECLAGAVARGLARAAKGRVHSIHEEPEPAAEGAAGEPPGPVPLTAVSLARAIRTAMGRRIQGLLRAAVRSQGVAIGADAVTGACQRGEAALVVVACDAAAGADLPEIRRAIAEGRAVAWGTKQQLGALAGGPREQGVAVMAISSSTLGAAIAGAVHVVDACSSVERGEPGTTPLRERSGRKERKAQRAAAAAHEGESAGNPGAAPVRAARDDIQMPGRGEDPEGGAQGRRAAPQGTGGQPSSRGSAAASRGERGTQTSESGRLLATAPESGKGGVVGGTWAASGSTGRAPTVDRVAAKRRPRGWVRRIG